jgi:hypothetical protein
MAFLIKSNIIGSAKDMLGILQHIVQQVNEAPNLHDALVIIVHQVQPHAMLPSLPAALKKRAANSPRRREGGYTTNAGVPKTSSSISWFKNTSAGPSGVKGRESAK